MATISTIFLRINLPQTLHSFASLLGETLLYHHYPCPHHLGNGIPLDHTTAYTTEGRMKGKAYRGKKKKASILSDLASSAKYPEVKREAED